MRREEEIIRNNQKPSEREYVSQANSLKGEDDSLHQLRDLIQQGIDSPGIPAGETAERLRRFAQELAQQ